MRISRDWLLDFVDFENLSTEEFSDLITTRVAEVDEVHEVAKPLSQAIVARIEEVRPHPDRDNLKVLDLNLGSDRVTVVCGAPNCRKEMFVAYLPPGAVVLSPGEEVGASGQVVEERAVSGVLSKGLLASEAELGLSSCNQGILELTPELLNESGGGCAPHRAGSKKSSKLVLGAGLVEYFGGPDTVLEIDNKSLTHRPDLWSHFGFAREIAAFLGLPLKCRADDWADVTPAGQKLLSKLGKGAPPVTVTLDDGSGCRRFAALSFENVSPSPSPLWMRRRLTAVGTGVKNRLVDLSNYVMHDIGQPNHAYDADLLSGTELRIRRALADEQFCGLDDKERKLNPEDIVIADASGVVALGGVIGGKNFSIGDNTSRIVLESANFDPVLVRRTTKRHQVRTDASNRFEKGLSAHGVPIGIHRFTELLLQLDPQAKIVGGVSDCKLEMPTAVSVPLRYEYIRERLGNDVTDMKITGILSSLGFNTSSTSKGEGTLGVPYFRTKDIGIKEDLVEEVGRILGYDSIPEEAPRIASRASASNKLVEFEYTMQDSLRAQGFSEIYNYSFMHAEDATSLGYPLDDAIQIQNPVDTNRDYIRTSLVPGMCEVVNKNLKHYSELYLYELGRSYQQSSLTESRGKGQEHSDSGVDERRLVCMAYSSGIDEKRMEKSTKPALPKGAGADFFALVSIVRRLTTLIGCREIELKPLGPSAGPLSAGNGQGAAADSDIGSYRCWMHPFRSAQMLVNGRVFGVIAEAAKGKIENTSQRVIFSEFDLESLYAEARKVREFEPISKFPDSFFEMSVVMPKRDHYLKLKEVIKSNVDQSLLRKIEVVAIYDGKPLAENEKSVSVRLQLGSSERTFSGEELTFLQEQLMAGVERSPYTLRS